MSGLMHPACTCGMLTGTCLCRTCVHSQAHAHTKANRADKIISHAASYSSPMPDAQMPRDPQQWNVSYCDAPFHQGKMHFLTADKSDFKCIITRKRESQIFG